MAPECRTHDQRISPLKQKPWLNYQHLVVSFFVGDMGFDFSLASLGLLPYLGDLGDPDVSNNPNIEIAHSSLTFYWKVKSFVG